MGEPYPVRWAPSARRDLSRLTENVAAACTEFVGGPIADNPQRLGKPLTRELVGKQAARRGAYRVIYQVNETEYLVTVLRVEHRADVYRPH